jgi:hypothetical protein
MDEKEKAALALSKQEAALKEQAAKETAGLESAREKQARQQAEDKIKAESELIKQQALAKKLAEKELIKQQAEKELIKQQAEKDQLALKQQPGQNAAKEKETAKQATLPSVKKTPVAASPVNLTPAANVNQRKTILQQTVTFSSDSLLLTLYDNGEVDGDTVSVLMNGQLIIAKQGLSTTASKKTIYIPSTTDRVELVMYAESLGSIPPNTGLLVIRDGKDLYEIRFSGDLQKNASIVFNRKKE